MASSYDENDNKNESFSISDLSEVEILQSLGKGFVLSSILLPIFFEKNSFSASGEVFSAYHQSSNQMIAIKTQKFTKKKDLDAIKEEGLKKN